MNIFKRGDKVHLLGIGGSGMSGIAHVLLQLGLTVSGSDIKDSEITERLKKKGALINYNQSNTKTNDCDYVIKSGAILSNNIELQSLKKQKKIILDRAKSLSIIMNLFKNRIAISGTHGKTTTSSLLVHVFHYLNHKPCYLLGSSFLNTNLCSDLGKNSTYSIAEADESDGSFLYLNPTQSIITNIEEDHMNFFKTKERLMKYFLKFLKKIPPSGYLYLNGDDKLLVELAQHINSSIPIIWYGSRDHCQYQAKSIVSSNQGIAFDLFKNGRYIQHVETNLSGVHNVYNSLAVISFMLENNFALPDVLKSLKHYPGVKRRLECLYDGKYLLFDDYAHHPTEVQTTLHGLKARYPNKRIFCIFQPHRFSRLANLEDAFSTSFDSTDFIIITEVYSAGETPLKNISGASLYQKTKSHYKNSTYIASINDIAPYLRPQLKQNDLVITMGAGNIYSILSELIPDKTL